MEINVRILVFFVLILDYITAPIFWLLSKRNKKKCKKIPEICDPLLLMSASKLAKCIRNKQVKSLNVTQAYIKRIKEVNPFLNAIVEERFNDAIEESKNIDKFLDTISEKEFENLEKDKPLLGVPITVKESCSVSGLSLSVGSLTRNNVKAKSDGQVVANVRAAGAIPLLVSNTPELCLGVETTNLITGRTNNPYSLDRTCGGSSGGEAALLGSGASVCGIASDIAGSIRIPAMFNGIFGHKPSPGIVSVEGHCPSSTDESFSKFLGIGPLVRYSEDLKPILKVIAGKNAEILKLDDPVNFEELNVFYMTECGKSIVLLSVDKEIQMKMKKAINHLKHECKVKIDERKFKDMEDSLEISVSVFFGMNDIPDLLQDENNPKHRKNLIIEVIKSILGYGMLSIQNLAFNFLTLTNIFIPKKSYNSYLNRANLLEKKIQKNLGDNGVLLYPTFPIPAFYHNQLYVKPAGILYSMIFNILGFPSTHVPLGLNSEGLPIGFQVVAGKNRDRLCIAVAEKLEKAFGGWVPPS